MVLLRAGLSLTLAGGFAQAVQQTEYELVAHLHLRNLERLEELFWSISDPGHPHYLRHLSLQATADLIGATEGELSEVQRWFEGLGARNGSVRVSPLRDTVSASLPLPLFAGAGGTAADPQKSVRLASRGRPPAVAFLLRRDATEDAATTNNIKTQYEEGGRYTINNIKSAYGMPADLQATSDKALQMVWGPGTFGYSQEALREHTASECPLLNMSKVKFDTENHGKSGGDNYGEGNLDTKMIASFGLNVNTLVSNTNTSASTEEGNGFGQALLDFATGLASREELPHVLSMSLGSLAPASCDLLCDMAVKKGHDRQECEDFMQQQRQVCMYLGKEQTSRINVAFQVLGVRGVSVFGSSGDGGSHFSFGRFRGGPMADVLNEISCEFQMPVFPTSSPYIVSVGGTMWAGGDPSHPVAWSESFLGAGSGSGFSWQFQMPEHQRGAVSKYLSSTSGLPPASSFNSTGRAYPDISAVGVSGTSQSCPIIAGIFSMLIDQRLAAGLPPLGFVAPRLWKLAESSPGEAFENVAEGNSKTSCSNGFPSSAAGWDPNTGWGRPIWQGMVKQFASDAVFQTGGHARGEQVPSEIQV